MNLERRSGSRSVRDSGDSEVRHSPRVVILDSGEGARVEVLDLPVTAAPGQQFCHGGASYRITGTRTANRVLIAEVSDH